MKTTLLSLLFSLLCLSIQAQVVAIPDTFFLRFLVSAGVDTSQDGKIQFSEAKKVKTLRMNSFANLTEITDLTGIQAFTELDTLILGFNYLTTVDLSQNTQLTYLAISDTRITEVDLSKNIKLVTLIVIGFTSLDVSKNLALHQVNCFYGKFSSLDVSNNLGLTLLNCSNNPNLAQICIDHSQLSDTSAWVKDKFAKWNASCGVVTGLENLPETSVSKIIERIYTPLGQLVLPENATNGLFIYQYSDGSTKKVWK